MRFAFNKLKLINWFALLFICNYHSAVYANQQSSLSPWFTSDQATTYAPNSKFSSQIKDRYLSQLAIRGARWQLDSFKINQLLTTKASENANEFDLLIPLPDGSLQLFKLHPVRVMAPKLAKKYPKLRSFKGVQAGNKYNTGRFDYSPDGFSGMFRYNDQWVMLSTNKNSDKTEYISYFAKDEIQPETQVSNSDFLTSKEKVTQKITAKALNLVAQRAIGKQIRTFRLAVSTSAEYTNANGGEASAMAEIVRLVNRINQILLVDLAIQFELVDNNDRLIFTNPNTDPFTNTDAISDIETNQQVADDLIGSANYDVGHLLSTNPGGLATLRSVCKADRTFIESGEEGVNAKAQSGSSRPSGESFYTQLVLHEFGHQLGAEHTFNASDQNNCDDVQRSRNSAVEPGSGSTIMSYAGLCGDQNIAQNNGGYFHAFSIEQIQSYLAERSCGASQVSGNALPSISTAPFQHTIPASTPFLLSAEVIDNDGDSLSYAWDQIDPGSFDGATANRQELETDNGANPLFRSYPPNSNPWRYFPRLNDVLKGVDSDGEVLPTETRQLNFELVVRDGNGGVNTLQAEVNIEQTREAFAVTRPQGSTAVSPVRWLGGQLQEVEWNTADTELAPFSCANVNILLDADGNNSFETTLASTTPNDGYHQVTSPNTNSTRARIMLRCSDSIFFAVNSGQFNILAGADSVAPFIADQRTKIIDEDNNFTISFADLSVEDLDSNYPENFTLIIAQGANYITAGDSITPFSNFNGALTVNVSVNDGINNSNIFPFVVQVAPINDTPTALDDAVTIDQDAINTRIDVLSNDLDPDQDPLTITQINYSGTGQASIANNSVSYSPAAGFSGTESISYKIEDPSFATSTATLTISVNAAPITPISTPVPTPTPLPTPPNSSGSGGGSIGHLLILLTIGCLVSMSSACVKSSHLQNKDLSVQAAKQDATLAAQSLDFRVLGFVRKLISLPGIDQAKYSSEWVEKHCGIRILTGVTDTVEIGQDLSLQKALRAYAEAYNKVIFKSCQIFQKDYSE